MKTIKLRWDGIRPLLMHNARLCDPEDSFKKKIDEISKKRNKTEADYKELAALEKEGGLYWNSEQDRPVIPSDNIERALQLGAMKTKKGKDIQAAVWCTQPWFELHHSGPNTLAKFLADPTTQLRKSVVIQKNRVFRVRPMFATGWWMEPEFEYDESVLDEKTIIRAGVDCGALIGLGDWRPKFGRFLSDVV